MVLMAAALLIRLVVFIMADSRFIHIHRPTVPIGLDFLSSEMSIDRLFIQSKVFLISRNLTLFFT